MDNFLTFIGTLITILIPLAGFIIYIKDWMDNERNERLRWQRRQEKKQDKITQYILDILREQRGITGAHNNVANEIFHVVRYLQSKDILAEYFHLDRENSPHIITITELDHLKRRVDLENTKTLNT